MRTGTRQIVDIAVIAVFAAALTFLLSGTKLSRSVKTCTGLQVELRDSLQFVAPEDIERFLKRRYGDYIGQRLDSIRLDRIEKMLESRSVVMESEAWTSEDGILHIGIVQRAPVLRFSKGEHGFYVDENGFVFPLHSSYTASVPTVTGNIPPVEKGGYEDWIQDLIRMTRYIDRSRTWSGRMEGISVTGDREITLTLKDRPEKFLIGEPKDIEKKLAGVEDYLTRILPEKGEGYYKSVNVKYNKQIICRKGI